MDAISAVVKTNPLQTIFEFVCNRAHTACVEQTERCLKEVVVKKQVATLAVWVLSLPMAWAQQPAIGDDACTKLVSLSLPTAKIVSAQIVAAGVFTPPGSTQLKPGSGLYTPPLDFGGK
jgi:hypothetical protein